MSTWYSDYSKLVDTVRPRTWGLTRIMFFLIHVPIIGVVNACAYPFRKARRKKYVRKQLN